MEIFLSIGILGFIIYSFNKLGIERDILYKESIDKFKKDEDEWDDL